METLPTVKIFKMDYDFLMKNYLNPELWKKEWTLFQYKTFTVTLQIHSIQTKDEKICFDVSVYNHDIEREGTDNKYHSLVECSLKIEDLTFLKRQINSCIFNNIVGMEKVYFIRQDEEYERMQELKYQERYRLKRYAYDFLDEVGITSEACRDAYVDAYVDENEQMYTLIDNWESEQVYRRITDFYLTFLSTLEDDPKKEIRTREIKNKLGNTEYQEVCDKIKDFVILMEDEENFEKEMKSKLEEVL